MVATLALALAMRPDAAFFERVLNQDTHPRNLLFHQDSGQAIRCFSQLHPFSIGNPTLRTAESIFYREVGNRIQTATTSQASHLKWVSDFKGEVEGLYDLSKDGETALIGAFTTNAGMANPFRNYAVFSAIRLKKRGENPNLTWAIRGDVRPIGGSLKPNGASLLLMQESGVIETYDGDLKGTVKLVRRLPVKTWFSEVYDYSPQSRHILSRGKVNDWLLTSLVDGKQINIPTPGSRAKGYLVGYKVRGGVAGKSLEYDFRAKKWKAIGGGFPIGLSPDRKLGLFINSSGNGLTVSKL